MHNIRLTIKRVEEDAHLPGLSAIHCRPSSMGIPQTLSYGYGRASCENDEAAYQGRILVNPLWKEVYLFMKARSQIGRIARN